MLIQDFNFIFFIFFSASASPKKKRLGKKRCFFCVNQYQIYQSHTQSFSGQAEQSSWILSMSFFKLNIYDSFFIFYYIFLVTFVSVWMRHSLIINESACQPCNIYAFLTLLRSISWKKAVLHWHFHHFKIYDIVSMSLILLVSFCFVQNFQITQHETIASAAILLSLQ